MQKKDMAKLKKYSGQLLIAGSNLIGWDFLIIKW